MSPARPPGPPADRPAASGPARSTGRADPSGGPPAGPDDPEAGASWASPADADGPHRDECWVLLRGLAREAGHWGDFPARLRAARPGARVLCPDLPGAGLRHRERSPASVPALAASVRAAVAATLAARPAAPGPAAGGAPPSPSRLPGRPTQPPPGLRLHLLGLSLGGLVALDWARQQPAEIGSLTLVNSSLRRHAGLRQRLRPAAWPVLLGALWPGRDRAALEAAVLALSTRHPEADPAALLACWTALAAARPVHPANALRQLLAAARCAGPAQPPVRPLQLIAGAGDALVDPACSAATARAWGVPLHVHPTAGHDLPLDAPDWLIAHLPP